MSRIEQELNLDISKLKKGWGLRVDIKFEGETLEKNKFMLVTGVDLLDTGERVLELVDLGGHEQRLLESAINAGLTAYQLTGVLKPEEVPPSFREIINEKFSRRATRVRPNPYDPPEFEPDWEAVAKYWGTSSENVATNSSN